MLFFAPELILLDLLTATIPRSAIWTTDLKSMDVDYPGEDIQALSFPDESVALICCNHVLEHVPDDLKALAECSRVLKPGGTAAFTIPGNFPKAQTSVFSKPDSNGHYRLYGMDILLHMKRFFREVKAKDMGEQTDRSWQVRRHDYVFLCEK